MTFDVPDASYYGALITNDSFEILVRKNANTGEGLFLRWPRNSDIRPDLLVQSFLDKEFGLSTKLIEGYDAIVFIKGGTLVNFIMHYLSGDIEAVDLQWVSLKTAWELVFKLESHDVLLSDSASLGILDGWIKNLKGQIYEESFDGEQKNWFKSFDRLCERVRNVLDKDSAYSGDYGLYSEYILSIIYSSKSKLKAQDDMNLYVNDLFCRAGRPGRSSALEADIIEAIHVGLTVAYSYFYASDYDVHARWCRRIERCLANLERIYAKSSLGIRRRAISGANGRWRDNDKTGRVKSDKIKAGQVKKIQSAILKVLEDKKLYRKTDRVDMIAGKIAGAVQYEISTLGLDDFFVDQDLKLFIWDFVSENRVARSLISKA